MNANEIVAYQAGRQSGIRWAIGFHLSIKDGLITEVKKNSCIESGRWSDKELQRDALCLDGEAEPKIGDSAPDGWAEWLDGR